MPGVRVPDSSASTVSAVTRQMLTSIILNEQSVCMLSSSREIFCVCDCCCLTVEGCAVLESREMCCAPELRDVLHSRVERC